MQVKGKRILKNGAVAGYVYYSKDRKWKWRIVYGPTKKGGMLREGMRVQYRNHMGHIKEGTVYRINANNLHVIDTAVLDMGENDSGGGGETEETISRNMVIEPSNLTNMNRANVNRGQNENLANTNRGQNLTNVNREAVMGVNSTNMNRGENSASVNVRNEVDTLIDDLNKNLEEQISRLGLEDIHFEPDIKFKNKLINFLNSPGVQKITFLVGTVLRDNGREQGKAHNLSFEINVHEKTIKIKQIRISADSLYGKKAKKIKKAKKKEINEKLKHFMGNLPNSLDGWLGKLILIKKSKLNSGRSEFSKARANRRQAEKKNRQHARTVLPEPNVHNFIDGSTSRLEEVLEIRGDIADFINENTSCRASLTQNNELVIFYGKKNRQNLEHITIHDKKKGSRGWKEIHLAAPLTSLKKVLYVPLYLDEYYQLKMGNIKNKESAFKLTQRHLNNIFRKFSNLRNCLQLALDKLMT